MEVWTPGKTLFDLERAAIEKALRFYNNNKSETSRSLGIAVRTLDNKLKTYEEMDAKNAEHASVPKENVQKANERQENYFRKVREGISSFSMEQAKGPPPAEHKYVEQKIQTRRVESKPKVKTSKGRKRGKKETSGATAS